MKTAINNYINSTEAIFAATTGNLTGGQTTYSMDIKITTVETKPTEGLYVELTTDVKMDDGTSAGPNVPGKADKIGDAKNNRLQVKYFTSAELAVNPDLAFEAQRTFAHELGHWLGLRHPIGSPAPANSDPLSETTYTEDAKNLMIQSVAGQGDNLLGKQFSTILNTIEKLVRLLKLALPRLILCKGH